MLGYEIVKSLIKNVFETLPMMNASVKAVLIFIINGASVNKIVRIF